jgi:signal transduction histidine kinase
MGAAAWFRNLPIARKLVVVIMLTTSAALAVAGMGITLRERSAARSRFANTALALAQVVALNSRAALVFDDQTTATETLAALAARPSIRAACIYKANGTVFARYPARGEPPPPARPGADGVHASGGDLAIFEPIVLEQTRVGTLYLLQDLSELRTSLKMFAAAAVLVLLLCLGAAYVISARLQALISKPILDLAAAARHVSAQKDYTVRVSRSGNDELGTLADGFNEMLAQVQARDVALEESRKDLETRVEQRTAQLQAANRELEAFAYSVSHDLRAPLRAIEGFSHILLTKYGGVVDETGQDYLRRVRAASQRMGELIEDLLSLSRVSRSELKREDVNLSDLARTVAAELSQRSPGRSVQFVIAPHVVTHADPHLLRVVLENLLGNAWKFTSKRDQACIEFGAETRDGKLVCFVRDNGAGFDMAFADRLFGAFQRLHSTAEFPGNGIGLASVKRIIHRHGGQVWAEGAVDQGATFYFSL